MVTSDESGFKMDFTIERDGRCSLYGVENGKNKKQARVQVPHQNACDL